MTVPKVPTIKRGGSRLYVDPDSGLKVPGVTSVLNMLPKPFLKFWAAKLVAETAVDHTPEFIGMVMKGDRQGAVDYLKRAPMRNTGQAADRGTEAHDIMEKMSLGKSVGRVAPDMLWVKDHFNEFLDAFEPEFLHLEGTVWNDDPGYAGSFDWIASIGDELVIGDNKTTRSGVHAEVALQLNAYAAADSLMSADGERTEMPQCQAAAVLHVVPDGWQLVPVMLDAERLMPVFHALLQVFEWDRDISKTVIGTALDPATWDQDVDPTVEGDND
jgi:hypothetical protein